MTHRRLVLPLLVALTPLAAVGSAWADSTLPPLPYRYLHPPAALAGTNKPPSALRRVLPVTRGVVQPAFLFTPDGQAGIGFDAGALRPGSGAHSVLIEIRPLESPPGLPAPLAIDGNAYSFSARAQPGKRPVQVVKPFSLTLRWLPPGGRGDFADDPVEALKSLVMPAVALSLPGAVALSRLVKATMLEVLYEDYVRTARAKGLAS